MVPQKVKTQTHTRTFRLTESIGPEGQFFEKLSNSFLHRFFANILLTFFVGKTNIEPTIVLDKENQKRRKNVTSDM